MEDRRSYLFIAGETLSGVTRPDSGSLKQEGCLSRRLRDMIYRENTFCSV